MECSCYSLSNNTFFLKKYHANISNSNSIVVIFTAGSDDNEGNVTKDKGSGLNLSCIFFVKFSSLTINYLTVITQIFHVMHLVYS